MLTGRAQTTPPNPPFARGGKETGALSPSPITRGLLLTGCAETTPRAPEEPMLTGRAETTPLTPPLQGGERDWRRLAKD